MYLIRHGLFTIPETRIVNVKQARALLSIAAWLQTRMVDQWIDGGEMPSQDRCPLASNCPSAEPFRPDNPKEFVLVLIGPGGTGKTVVLKAAEALIDHFAGSESVRKCALSNTASRLLGGDTLHALCKLPRFDLQRLTGKLSGPVLQRHRERWRTAVGLFVDEISMVAPEQLHQADIRVQQATRNYHRAFGGLGTVLSGDFMQLPPVERGSLAKVPSYEATVQDEDGGARECDVSTRGR